MTGRSVIAFSAACVATEEIVATCVTPCCTNSLIISESVGMSPCALRSMIVMVESRTYPESAKARKNPSRASSSGNDDETCAYPMMLRGVSVLVPQAAASASGTTHIALRSLPTTVKGMVELRCAVTLGRQPRSAAGSLSHGSLVPSEHVYGPVPGELSRAEMALDTVPHAAMDRRTRQSRHRRIRRRSSHKRRNEPLRFRRGTQ